MLLDIETSSNTSITGRFKAPSERYLERKQRAKASREAKAKIKEAMLKGTKLCSKCSLEKSLFSFDVDKSTFTGYSSWCKDCKKQYNQRYRKSENIGDSDD